jgi:hypothetical protein
VNNSEKNAELFPVRGINSVKNAVVNSTSFAEALERALNGEDPEMDGEPFFSKSNSNEWIKKFAEQSRDVLERLYLRHRIRPAVPLGTINFYICQQVDLLVGLRRHTPPLISNPKLREKRAAAWEKVADEFDLIARLSETRDWPLRGGDRIRDCARRLRAVRCKNVGGRPVDWELTNCATALTEEFIKLTGNPLWDYTAELMSLALDRLAVTKTRPFERVRDSIRKAVKGEWRRRGKIWSPKVANR